MRNGTLEPTRTAVERRTVVTLGSDRLDTDDDTSSMIEAPFPPCFSDPGSFNERSEMR
jgi:hypothetical protein